MKLNSNEQFSADLKRNLAEHQPMLSDGVRNKLIYQALREKISTQTSFLDIGAGTGVWAILAAKLGAKRVVAVELEECLIPIIYQHAKENGVADKVEIVHANADDIVLQEKFDVIISELFGYDAYGEKTIKSFVKLRKNYLKNDGILIPQKMQQFAVPVKIVNSVEKIGENLPFESMFFKSIRLNYNQNYSTSNRDEIEFLAEPKKILEVDFRTIQEPPDLVGLNATFESGKLDMANAFAVYNHSYYTDEIVLNSFNSSSWVVGIYEFKPFTKRAKDIKFDITMTNKKVNWKISSPSNPNIRTQIYSPGFSVARIKLAQSSTPQC